MVEDFWKRWSELYAPAFVVQSRWHTATRNLRPGDVVIVADRNTLRGHYCLALVKDVSRGRWQSTEGDCPIQELSHWRKFKSIGVRERLWSQGQFSALPYLFQWISVRRQSQEMQMTLRILIINVYLVTFL